MYQMIYIFGIYHYIERALFKKIRDIKETFHTKMGTIKDRKGMHLIEEKY